MLRDVNQLNPRNGGPDRNAPRAGSTDPVENVAEAGSSLFPNSPTGQYIPAENPYDHRTVPRLHTILVRRSPAPERDSSPDSSLASIHAKGKDASASNFPLIAVRAPLIKRRLDASLGGPGTRRFPRCQTSFRADSNKNESRSWPGSSVLP